MRNHSKVQLVEYECKDIKYNEHTHINLFGTLTRFYSLFDVESVNMEYCIFVDVDNYISREYLNIIDEFMKTDKLVMTVNRLNQISFFENDVMYKDDLFYNIHLLGGMTMIKRDSIFKDSIWNQYFHHLFEQNDLNYVYDYLDFKKNSFYFILNRNNNHIKNDELITSYHSFYYGSDEIWLNFVIKKILRENGLEDKLMVYYTKDYDFNIFGMKMKEMIEYNKVVNKDGLRYFFSDMTFVKNNHMTMNKKKKKSKDTEKRTMNINENVKRMKDEIDNMLNTSFNKRNIKFISFMKRLSKNKYLNRIYLQSKMKYFIYYIDK